MNAREQHKIYNRENTRKRRKNGKQKDWFDRNPNKKREYEDNHKLKQHDISQSEWDECRIYFNFRCAYCDKTWEQNKIETKKDLHKEHVNNKGANNLSNCVPGCMICNSNKWERDLDEWYTEDNPVFSMERKERILKWINVDHLKYIKVKST